MEPMDSSFQQFSAATGMSTNSARAKRLGEAPWLAQLIRTLRGVGGLIIIRT